MLPGTRCAPCGPTGAHRRPSRSVGGCRHRAAKQSPSLSLHGRSERSADFEDFADEEAEAAREQHVRAVAESFAKLTPFLRVYATHCSGYTAAVRRLAEAFFQARRVCGLGCVVSQKKTCPFGTALTPLPYCKALADPPLINPQMAGWQTLATEDL